MRLIGKTSLTGRLTFLFVATSSAVLLALGLVIGTAVEKHFEEQDVDALTGKMELARHTLEKVGSAHDLERLPELLSDSLVGHHGLAVIVLDHNHKVVFASAGAEFPRDLITANAARNSKRPIVWRQGNVDFRGMSASLATGIRTMPPFVVAVATDIAHHQAFMSVFLRTLWIFVAVAAVLMGLLGWIVARRGLAPLRAMRDKAATVTAKELSHRLPVDSVPVELAELAETLNDMLSRLQEAFRRLSDFSSDIAHELRTPISNLMTQTQVALAKSRRAEDYRAILESNGEEFERMGRMISDMLFLAKADNGLAVPTHEAVNLASEIRDLFDYYDALAEEKGLRLVVEGNGTVMGDRLMLRRALNNLLSNAVRHSIANGTVRISLNASCDAVSIRTENTGDPIPQECLERVFDRFFRVDPSRQRNGEGTGLGLAITRSIVVAHGGSITVKSLDDMTVFTAILPLLADGPAPHSLPVASVDSLAAIGQR